MREIVLIAHNLRSTHNVGSLLRTADGLGVNQVYLTGYTPYPTKARDERLPHLAKKIDRQINKTALGAQNSLKWSQRDDIFLAVRQLKAKGYRVAALEQVPNSVSLPKFKPSKKVVLIVGREVEGLEPDVIKQADIVLEIPMLGKKESLNVVQAAAIALYHCRYF